MSEQSHFVEEPAEVDGNLLSLISAQINANLIARESFEVGRSWRIAERSLSRT